FENEITSREKLFLVGGSYGGYMALLLHGRHPEYFKAVVDIFGPSDLFTFVQSVPPHWKPIMERWLGDPERDKERFVKDSPVTYLDGMTKPMLVIQGAKDPRVVKEESDQIVAKLKEEGRDVEYLVLDDEGHGFSKKKEEDNKLSLYFWLGSSIVIVILLIYFILRKNPMFIAKHIYKHPESTSLYVSLNNEPIITHEPNTMRPLASTMKIMIAIEY